MGCSPHLSNDYLFGSFRVAFRKVSGFTRILEGVERGDPKAAGELLPLVYEELRRLAAHKMTNESLGNTLTSNSASTG